MGDLGEVAEPARGLGDVSELEAGLEELKREIAARKQAEAHLLDALARESALSRASGAIAEAGLDLRSVAQAVAREVGVQVGEFCVVTILADDGGSSRTMGVHHPNAAIAELIWRVTGSEIPVGEPLATVIATGEPTVIAHVDADFIHTIRPEVQDLVDEQGVLETLMVVPLKAGGQVIGAMASGRRDGPAYSADDLEFVVEVGERAGPALDTAVTHRRLVRDLQERRAAELALQRGNRELARRIAASSEDLTRSHRELDSLFEDSPIPMILADCSGVVSYVESLADDVHDLEEFFDRRTELLLVALGRISVTNVNQALVDLFGLASKDKAVGSITRFYNATRHAFFKAQLLAVANKRPHFIDEVLLQGSGGDQRHVSVQWRVLPGHLDDFSRVLVSLIDRTEEVRAQAELERLNAELAERVETRSEELTRTGLELSLLSDIVQASDAAITAATVEGVITIWNPGAERLFGYSASEAIGMHELDLVPPEGRPGFAELLARVLDGESVQTELERVAKDRSRIWITASVAPVRDDSGEIIGFGSVSHDVSAARQDRASSVEDRIEVLAEFSQTLAEAAGDVQELLRTTARTAAGVLGDASVVHLLSDDAAWLLPVAYHHPDPAAMELLGEGLTQAHRVDESIAAPSVVEGRTVLLPDIDAGDVLNAAAGGSAFADKVGVRSVMSAPLAVRGRIYGAVCVSRDRGSPAYGAPDMSLLEELALRSAVVIAKTGFLD